MEKILKYEKPQLISLSESDMTYGAPCFTHGNSATDCSSFGFNANNDCNDGNTAGVQCLSGNSPIMGCNFGDKVPV